MDCKGNFKDDRVCQLCYKIDGVLHYECKELTEEKRNNHIMLYEIGEKCSKRLEAYDEYQKFFACTLNENGHGRSAEECKPKLCCKKYARQINKPR